MNKFILKTFVNLKKIESACNCENLYLDDGVMLILTDLVNSQGVTPIEGNFFRYNGGLTTPGCNEIVRWTVFNESIGISDRQVKSTFDTNCVYYYVQQDN